MSENSSSKKRTVTVKKIRRRMTLVYTLLLIAVFIVGSLIAAEVNERQLTNELADKVTALDLTLARSAEDFVFYAETDCTRVFMSDAAKFDPLDGSVDEGEKSAALNDVKAQLLELSAGRHYNDFFIIYSDGSSVGNISKGEEERLAKAGFESLEKLLDGGSDRWFAENVPNGEKICYIRRFSENAVFMLSFYSDELDGLVSGSGVVSIIADENDVVIAGNSDCVSGEKIPQKYLSLFNDTNGECAVADGYVASSIKTDNGWTAVAAYEMPTPFFKSADALGAMLAALAALAAASVLVGTLSCMDYSAMTVAKPNNEFIDNVTGALNEYGLDEKVSEMLDTLVVGSTCAMIAIAPDDAENIKPTISLRSWNAMRMRIIETAEKYFFKRRFHIARINEDHIVLFVDFSEFDIFKAHENLRTSCEGLCKAFENFALTEGGDILINISIGASIYPDNAEDFDALLEQAEAARKLAEAEDGCAFRMYTPEKGGGQHQSGKP